MKADFPSVSTYSIQILSISQNITAKSQQDNTIVNQLNDNKNYSKIF